MNMTESTDFSLNFHINVKTQCDTKQLIFTMNPSNTGALMCLTIYTTCIPYVYEIYSEELLLQGFNFPSTNIYGVPNYWFLLTIIKS